MTSNLSRQKEVTVKNVKSAIIHALEFECEAPLRFFEQCSSCPRFDGDCQDLALGKAILAGKKKLSYSENHSEGTVNANTFGCLAPLYYFEQTRKSCAHGGRCREEGLLLALLDGKKTLSYTQKSVIELPRLHTRQQRALGQEQAEGFQQASS
jgi:hypothetical protein